MVFTGLALAQVADGGQTTVLQQQKLADMSRKHGVVVLVSYAPGKASAPHRHPGSVFAYVFEGEVTSRSGLLNRSVSFGAGLRLNAAQRLQRVV